MKKLTLKEALFDAYKNLSEKEKIRLERKYVRKIKFPLENKDEFNFISIEEYEKWLEKNNLKK
jgi:hypothetical protein